MQSVSEHKKYKDYAWMHQKYVVEELSMSAIGELVGCGSTTVYAWLHRFGISTSAWP